MNAIKFKQIGLFIIVMIMLTVIIQSYTIYEYYKGAKQQYQIDIQNALDKSIEQYYAEIAKSDVLTFTDLRNIDSDIDIKRVISPDTTLYDISFFKRFSKSKLSQAQVAKLDQEAILRTDSLKISQIIVDKGFSQIDVLADQINGIAMFKGRKAADSLDGIQALKNKITITITRDTLDYSQLHQFLSDQLKRINYKIDYAFTHHKKDSLVGGFNKELIDSFSLQATANPTYIPQDEYLIMYFENSRMEVLKKGFISIFSSVLFIIFIAVILLYLYKVIKSQKELSEIKNDLITNITHEFKTPIATISTAVEGIQKFNQENDPIKTDKYLNISNQQLTKLNLMVEKLLETATLDSDKLILKKELLDVENLLVQLIDKYKEAGNSKPIKLFIQNEIKPLAVDPFHFENAISNLIDNAIKYGGNNISIYLNQQEELSIMVEDNGGNIPKEQKQKVFDKFYRIPKGNVHDVRGFGIGLYYTKNIIEKHNGRIDLILKEGKTIFKITV